MRTRIILGAAAVTAGALVIVAGFFGLRALVHGTDTKPVAFDHCDIGTYELDPDQAAVASTMVGAVTRYDQESLPEQAAVLALAAALQESKLRNLPLGAGDRDSVGVLQQRPSQGWGTATQINDVGYATTQFLDRLVKIEGWQTLPLADAIQDVQISADGSLYAQYQDEAQALADALQGHRPAGITCTFAPPAAVAAPAAVVAAVRKDLPVNPPTTTAASAKLPAQVRVPGAAWQTAAWFVANADRLGIEQVAYDGRVWERSKGWKAAAAASSAAVVATMYQTSGQ